ncbi:MAG TPA: LysR family transcriptional regulator [Gammaproteobacteria bacterium]|nr:LysR family transcriptional regulator [Gammaproteobacteria bacterium]
MIVTSQRFIFKQNRLKQLRAFCMAAQTGSISRAAEQMFLSQPSISLLIKSLEKDLDTNLFNRNGPRIHLSEQGNQLLELALPLVEGVETLPEAFLERLENKVSGELNIAAGETATLYILPDTIKRYKDLYPEVRIKLHNVTNRDAMGLLLAGEVDIGIGSILNVPEEFVYIPTVEYRPVLITPPGHPLLRKDGASLEEITAHSLIIPPRHLTTWQMVELVFQQHNIHYSVALETGGWEAIKKYVEMGLGISIVTSVCLSGREKLGTIQLPDYFPNRNYGLIARKGKYFSPAVRKFVQLFDDNALPEFYNQNPVK